MDNISTRTSSIHGIGMIKSESADRSTIAAGSKVPTLREQDPSAGDMIERMTNAFMEDGRLRTNINYAEIKELEKPLQAAIEQGVRNNPKMDNFVMRKLVRNQISDVFSTFRKKPEEIAPKIARMSRFNELITLPQRLATYSTKDLINDERQVIRKATTLKGDDKAIALATAHGLEAELKQRVNRQYNYEILDRLVSHHRYADQAVDRTKLAPSAAKILEKKSPIPLSVVKWVGQRLVENPEQYALSKMMPNVDHHAVTQHFEQHPEFAKIVEKMKKTDHASQDVRMAQKSLASAIWRNHLSDDVQRFSQKHVTASEVLGRATVEERHAFIEGNALSEGARQFLKDLSLD